MQTFSMAQCLYCLFQGKAVSFYKRAQILVADFWGIMEARGQGDIINMDWLTMFADYRVPQALVYLGALRYSDKLIETLKSGEPSVCACVCLKKKHLKMLKQWKVLVAEWSQSMPHNCSVPGSTWDGDLCCMSYPLLSCFLSSYLLILSITYAKTIVNNNHCMYTFVSHLSQVSCCVQGTGERLRFEVVLFAVWSWSKNVFVGWCRKETDRPATSTL